jgi:hypothetical protein
MRVNHYKWLEKHFPDFIEKLLGGDAALHCKGLIGAHGDKCYSYKERFQNHGIPFPHGVTMYLLCRLSPYSSEVRDTENGWVDPFDWIISNKDNYIHLLNPIDETDPEVTDNW